MSSAAGEHPATPFAPGTRIGSYLVERKLGAGGMGTVFLAKHIGLDKPVVLKALSPLLAARENSVIRFVREGRAASKIRHPHVVDVTDVGTHEGIPFLIMEYLAGEDLESHLASVGMLTPTEIARVMLPVIDAVAFAHEEGVVHRDLKPANIFLAAGPHGRQIPKVLDFGIAKLLDTDEVNRKTITHAAAFLGTPFYSSPEQAKSGKSADARSDQYSLGAILYELATGERSVRGETPFQVLSAIIAKQTVPIRTARSDVHPVLAWIVERAMAYEPQERFSSLRELGAELLVLADPAVHAQWAPAFGGARPAPIESPPSRDAGARFSQPLAPELPGPTPVASAAVSGVSTISPVAAPARSSHLGLYLAASLAGLLVAAAGAAALYALGPSASPSSGVETPPTETPSTETSPPESETSSPEPPSHFEIEARPAATFELDGLVVGEGERVTLAVDDGDEHLLRVSAAGRQPRELRFDRTHPPPPLLALPPLASDETAEETPHEDPAPSNGEVEDDRGGAPGESVEAPARPSRHEVQQRPPRTARRAPTPRPLAPPTGPPRATTWGRTSPPRTSPRTSPPRSSPPRTERGTNGALIIDR